MTSLNALSPIQERWRHVRALAYELDRRDTIQFLVVDTKKSNCSWSRAQLSTSYYDFLPPPFVSVLLPSERHGEGGKISDRGWVTFAHWLVNIKDSYEDQTGCRLRDLRNHAC